MNVAVVPVSARRAAPAALGSYDRARRAAALGAHGLAHSRARAVELARRFGQALVGVGDAVLAADGDVLLRALLVLGGTQRVVRARAQPWFGFGLG